MTRGRGPPVASNAVSTGGTSVASWTRAPARPTKKSPGPAHLQVVDQLPWLPDHGDHPGRSSHDSQVVAGLEISRHLPALACLPEPVDVGGDDRLAAVELHAQDLGWGVMKHREDRLVVEAPWWCPGSAPGHRSSASRWRGAPRGEMTGVPAAKQLCGRGITWLCVTLTTGGGGV